MSRRATLSQSSDYHTLTLRVTALGNDEFTGAGVLLLAAEAGKGTGVGATWAGSVGA